MAVNSFDDISKLTPPKKKIYLDANFLVSLYYENSRFHRSCKDFLKALKSRGFNVFISTTVVKEYLHGITQVEMGKAYGDNWRKLYKDGSAFLTEDITKILTKALGLVLDLAIIKEILPSSKEHIENLSSVMGEYNLFSNDAFHLKVMKHNKVFALATIDKDFASSDIYIYTCNPKMLKQVQAR